MFAKVFNQIYDSSIVESPETRFTFIDFLILADLNGVVDMTHEAISRRTNRPIELIRSTIAELEGPDPRSRTPDMNGARIYRLDEHRDWGWGIVNYDYFRHLASQEQRREKTRLRVRRHRVTQRNAVKRSGNDSPSASASSSISFLEELKRNPFNAGVDIDSELEKANKWCKRKNRRCTERFFRKWVERADRIVPNPPKKASTPVNNVSLTDEPQIEQDPEKRKLILSQHMKELTDKFRMPK